MKIKVNEPNKQEVVQSSTLKAGDLVEMHNSISRYRGEILMVYGTFGHVVSLTNPENFWDSPQTVRRLSSGSIVTLTQDDVVPAPVVAPPVSVPLSKVTPEMNDRARIDGILFDSDRREIRKLLRKGEAIQAIKYVRTKTNEGLKEAKNYVDYTRETMPYDEQ